MDRHGRHNFRIGILWAQTDHSTGTCTATMCVIDNIVVMWIVLIREYVTAGVSGSIDKGTEKRLEMMWCQHGCHSCKEQEVYNAVRTTQLHTVTTETIDTLRPFGVTGGLSLQSCVSSMRRETDHLRSEMARFTVSATSTNSASDLL